MNSVEKQICVPIPDVPSDREILEREILKRRYTWTEDRNCLSWWYPRITGAGVPAPETEVLITDVQFAHLFDGKEPIGLGEFIECLSKAVERRGTPCFLRTGQTSAKHSWDRACFVQDVGKLTSHVYAIAEFSELCDMLGLPWHVWAVRELLPTTPLFRCRAYDDFPVARELRVFVDDDQVMYHIPYWPEEALKEGRPDAPNWLDVYRRKYQFSQVELNQAHALAARCGAACNGRWSVDVLFADNGAYVTDMAIAERSWGYDVNQFEC